MAKLLKIRVVAAAAAATAALAAPLGARAETPPGPQQGATLEAPAAPPTQAAPAPAAPQPQPQQPAEPPKVEQGDTLAPPKPSPGVKQAPSVPKPPQPAKPRQTKPGGGVQAPDRAPDRAEEEVAAQTGSGAGATGPGAALTIPSLPTSTCASTGVPPALIPLYRRAAATYRLGPQGPAILAGINQIETGFGSNLGPSSAGAVGWMQFMPATWEAYGVDANDDGVADPNNPEDAIFSAANYLSASGMPEDVYGAIFAYNHADWYVEDVLANAACYAGEVGGPSFAATGMAPKIQVFNCTPARGWRKQIPAEHLRAFEDAAARYELGRRGVWALAAVARLESDFGRGMSKAQLRELGPLGLDETEWRAYAVDGDQDGKIRRQDPADSAATLARLIWSRGSISAGLFAHNQAEWYVEAVLREADRMEGTCKVRYAEWALAPLGTGLETAGGRATLTASGMATVPRNAPPAVKAVIAAANSIAHTPYVWGGGHGSWYSYGYDCSGAVSFALYGAGLLDTPLTSGQLESYGEPGPGKWITIYANATHTYAVIAGLRWDTVGNENGSGPRWHPEPPYPDGFVVRHPPGY